jgi:hypothetical protein
MVVSDIFRRATELGGHLVVAFVAPVSASSRTSRARTSIQFSSPALQAASAQTMVTELIGELTRQRIRAANGSKTETASTPGRTPKPPSAG